MYQDILRQYWGYDDFRGIQRDIIESIGSGRDTLGLMPTGGGKSITFQVPALAQKGTCLVITPLIALMKDQVKHLKERGIRATAIYSGMTHDQVLTQLENCIYSDMKFLYVSPERLASELFRVKLKHMNISFITVDEAHCISQWGYDFRPSYLQISEVRELLPGTPVLALTATATPGVVDDIQDRLGFKEKNVFRMSFERANLFYVVREAIDKEAELIHILKSVPGSAIVYARSRQGVRDLAKRLNSEGISTLFYHAGLSNLDKDVRQQAWTTGQVRVMVATNAFGMGIDKADVRLVVHMDLPDSPEAYFQEAGRGGRDGQTAYAVLLYNSRDHGKLLRRVSENFPEKDFVRSIYDQVCWFLQLAEGYGYNTTYEFNLEEFCRHYKRFPLPVLSALAILTRAGYIDFRAEDERRSRILFLMSRDDLYDAHLSDEAERVVEALMRSYGGLFSDYVFIEEDRIAKQAGVEKRGVYEILKFLTQQRIVHYVPAKKIPRITFTTSRVEGRLVRISKEVYEDRKQQYEARIHYMLNYATGDDECRSRFLLKYFGEEDSQDCGHCDVCLSKSQPTAASLAAKARHHILCQLSTEKPLPAFQLKSEGFDHDLVAQVIDDLTADGVIRVDEGGLLLLSAESTEV